MDDNLTYSPPKTWVFYYVLKVKSYIAPTLNQNEGAEAEIKKPHYAMRLIEYGVADGARTHDNRNHNPGLYQLSYNHHKAKDNQ